MPATIQGNQRNRGPSIDAGEPPARVLDAPRDDCSLTAVPLVVDLDGTLLRTDLLHECVLSLIKQNPWKIFAFPIWLLRGRKYLKRRVFDEARLDPTLLPVHSDVLAMVREEKANGRQLILATASGKEIAERTVGHLGLFDAVLGSDGGRDLKGAEKLAAIEEYCRCPFDYAGNSRADLAVWQHSRHAILVNPGAGLETEARRNANVTHVISEKSVGWRAALRSARVYQWVKNLLIFVPAFTSHQALRWPILLDCVLAFAAFSLCASATYIVNDLLDLEDDRRDPVKRLRPLAAGECSIRRAAMFAGTCLFFGLSMAWIEGNGLLPILTLYLALTACYSLYLKKIFLLDVLALAILYTVRVLAGHVVTEIVFSMWLLTFSFFLFLSLAFSKRAAELIRVGQSQKQSVPGRGYLVADLQVISVAGICSGFLSSLVLALYINSESVTLLYRRPSILWGILPLLLYYIVRVWIICGRGELDDDPIVYTAREKSTYLIAALVLLLVIAATLRY
jgi:4-hydroxybenzoate polyprenyltransferase